MGEDKGMLGQDYAAPSPAAGRGVNLVLSDLTDEQQAALTDSQREALQRAERGELPVDARSPLYDEPASANFVHSLDPEAGSKGGPTDTVPDELLTTQTGEHGLVTNYHGDVVVDERLLGAGTEPGGEFSSQYGQPTGEHAPEGGVQSDGSPTEGPAAVGETDGAASPIYDELQAEQDAADLDASVAMDLDANDEESSESV